jgi:hypothetical protein
MGNSRSKTHPQPVRTVLVSSTLDLDTPDNPKPAYEAPSVPNVGVTSGAEVSQARLSKFASAVSRVHTSWTRMTAPKPNPSDKYSYYSGKNWEWHKFIHS